MPTSKLKPSVGKISVGLGYALYSIAKWMLRHGLNVKYYTITANELKNIAKQQIGCDCWFWDGKYWYTDLDTWKVIVQRDELNEYKQWVLDRFDCDNFAVTFSSHMAEFFDMNSAGVALGAVLDKNTKQEIGYHAYNCFIVNSNGKAELWLYEPQNDYMSKASRVTDMGWSLYRTDVIIWR
jgi:hypothetical protein